MVRLLAIAAFATLPMWHLSAAETALPDHSTIHIVFIAPYDNPSTTMGFTDTDGKPVPMASTGNVVVPFDSFRPVSIAIDSEFVGHALFGYDKVSPIFILPTGEHEFSFSCAGFKPVTQGIHVLGYGSTQYLVIKMYSSDDDISDTNSTPPATASTHQDVK